MDQVFADLPEPRCLGYLGQAEAAVNRAARSSSNELVLGYLRLAQCWSRLAAAVQDTGTADRRDAA